MPHVKVASRDRITLYQAQCGSIPHTAFLVTVNTLKLSYQAINGEKVGNYVQTGLYPERH